MENRPYIMIIDDEPPALTAMLDALARRFGGDYQVVSHLQVTTALEELEKIKEDGNKVALIIADQWMPEMTGAELLQRAHLVHPGAQRALLVATTGTPGPPPPSRRPGPTGGTARDHSLSGGDRFLAQIIRLVRPWNDRFYGRMVGSSTCYTDAHNHC